MFLELLDYAKMEIFLNLKKYKLPIILEYVFIQNYKHIFLI